MRDRGSARVSSVRRVNCLRSPITTIGASADRADSRNGYYADRNVNSPRMSRSAPETRVTGRTSEEVGCRIKALEGPWAETVQESPRGEKKLRARHLSGLRLIGRAPIRVSQEPILGPGCGCAHGDACATSSSSVSRPVGPAAGTAIHSQTVAPTGQSSSPGVSAD